MFKKINLINYLIALIPFSLILGNLITNINIIIICILGIIFYGKEIFLIKKKYQILIYFFFIYLIIITGINNIPNFETNSLYQQNFIKSLFFLRFLILFLVINKLIEKNELNIKFFFYSASFFSILISFDIIIQVIYGKNLIGYEITAFRPSGFFGDEHIAGSYLQKFVLFPLFLFAIYKKNNFKFLMLSLIFFIPILLTSNRMPTLIFCASIFFYFILEKKKITSFFFIIILIFLITVSLKFPLTKKFDTQINAFAKDGLEIIIKTPKLFFTNTDEKFKNFGTGYLTIFNAGIQTWKENKFFGQGLKSFRLNCKFDVNQTCANHPHNYVLELMLDVGLIGLISIYGIYLFALINFVKFLTLINSIKIKLLSMPFFLITFFEFFPFRSSGSFFTTNNASIIFIILAIFINIEKIKFFYKK